MASDAEEMTHMELAVAYLDSAQQMKIDKGEAAWVTIAHAQTHATLALVDAVKVLTEIVKVKP